MRRRFEGVAAVGEAVEVFGAVVAASIEEEAAPVLSTERAAARPEDRWVAVWHEDRPEVPQYAVQWAAVPPRVRAGLRQYAGQWVAAPQ